jgi:hypothetical protein
MTTTKHTCDMCGAELPANEEHTCRVVRGETVIFTRFTPKALIPPPPTREDILGAYVVSRSFFDVTGKFPEPEGDK